jgi:DNA-binding transcriptional MerR regulator
MSKAHIIGQCDPFGGAGWTVRALARMTDLPVQTISSWITAGLITPDHFGRGRGGHTIGMSGLMELLAVAELRQAGFSLQAVRQAVENLRYLTGRARPLANLTLVISGNDIVWRDEEDVAEAQVSALRKPGQRLMVFPVGERHAELMRQLAPAASAVGCGEEKATRLSGMDVR